MAAYIYGAGANLEWTTAAIGGPIQEYDYQPVISNTVVQVLPNNADRVELIFSNQSTQDIVVGWDAAALTLGSGVKVIQQGGNVVFKLRDDFTLVTRSWFAVGTLTPSTLYIVELVRIVRTVAPTGT